MPRPALVTLALGAQDNGGLISMLSGFVEALQGPHLPIRQHLFAVARLHLSDEEVGHDLMVVVRVEHADGEQIVRLEATLHAERGPQYSPDLPVGVNLVLPLDLELRREGLYRLTLTSDGELLGEAPLRVTALIPSL